MVDQEIPVCRLPSSPLSRCLDRFAIVEDAEEDDEGLVPSWSVLHVLLLRPVASPEQLIDLLETIAITLRGSTGFGGDYGYLRDFVARRWTSDNDNAFEKYWPEMARLALDMPNLFADGCLPILTTEGRSLRLSRRQVGCLVVHQFLCTLEPPPFRSYLDDFIDFSIWYASEQPHPKACEMYLTALFTFLEGIATEEEPSGSSSPNKSGVVYTLHQDDNNNTMDRTQQSEDSTPLMHPEVMFVAQYDTSTQTREFQGPNGAVVVSSNRVIGFGKSATQEEIYMGLCPSSCPAVLVTPKLTDTTVLTICGAQPMLQAIGQRRNITWKTFVDHPATTGGSMILMDALELDEQEDHGDLKPENIDREIRKAFVGFSAGRWFDTVWTGPWGCGAFGGDAAVKFVILWIAASMAGLRELKIVCDASHRELGTSFENFAGAAAKGLLTVGELCKLLVQVPREKKGIYVLDWLSEQILTRR